MFSTFCLNIAWITSRLGHSLTLWWFWMFVGSENLLHQLHQLLHQGSAGQSGRGRAGRGGAGAGQNGMKIVNSSAGYWQKNIWKWWFLKKCICSWSRVIFAPPVPVGRSRDGILRGRATCFPHGEGSLGRVFNSIHDRNWHKIELSWTVKKIRKDCIL